MRAAFSFSFAIDGTIFDLKSYPMTDESKVEIKRTTAFKDAVSGQASPYAKGGKISPEAKVEAAKISRVSVSNLTGEVVSDTQMLKGVWRNEHEFVEVSDADLAALRMSNGEFRALGVVNDEEDIYLKGQTLIVRPAKTTVEARSRFLSLAKALQDTALLIEGSVRGKQRLYMLTAYNGVMCLDEIAYYEEFAGFEFPEEVSYEEMEAVEAADLSSLPELEERPRSSFITAFNEKYGMEN